MRLLRLVFVAAAVLLIVPGWSGDTRLPLLDPRHPQIDATPVQLDPHDPRRTRVGRLSFVAGWSLTSRDPAWGGFSSLSVDGNRVTLLSDGGTLASFAITPAGRLHDIAFANLPSGPGIGWTKADRDSESFTTDPATGTHWVGFEVHNAIWRYSRDWRYAEGEVEPRAMHRWDDNGGPESLVRLRDGRFVTISETTRVRPRAWRGTADGRRRSRQGLIFATDPTGPQPPPRRFAFMATPGFNPSDATELPNGDLVLLERRFRLPYRFDNRVALVPRQEVRPGGLARPRLLARLEAPLIHDNFEGVAVTRENGATILWLVSDDNQSWLQRTLLLKFRLD